MSSVGSWARRILTLSLDPSFLPNPSCRSPRPVNLGAPTLPVILPHLHSDGEIVPNSRTA